MKKLIALLVAATCGLGAMAQTCEGLEIAMVQRNPFMPTFWTVSVTNAGPELYSYPGFRIYDANTNELLGEEVVNFFGIAPDSNHNVNVGIIADIGVEFDLRLELWTDFYEVLACEIEWSGQVYPADFECVEVEFQFQVGDWQSPNVVENYAWSLTNDQGEEFAGSELVFTQAESMSYTTVCMPTGCHVFNLTFDGEDHPNFVYVNLYSQQFPLPSFNLTLVPGQNLLNTAFEVYNCLETSVAEKEGKSWSFHPNPATDRIELVGLGSGSAYKLMDAQGRRVLEGRLNADASIDVSMLVPGMYLLESEASVLRLIKE